MVDVLVMFTTGAGFTVTCTVEDVVKHPAALLAASANVPEVFTVMLCVVCPLVQL